MSCKSCDYYDYKGANEKGYCEYYKAYYYPTDYCSHEKSGSSGCYVTTIVHNILGLSDDCEELQTLRKLREQMQKDEKNAGLLFEYDTVGPQIANDIEKMYKEDKDSSIWKKYFDFYIKNTVEYIKENDYQNAIFGYKEMFTSLKSLFGYKDLPYTIPQDYDYSVGGHGYVKTI